MFWYQFNSTNLAQKVDETDPNLIYVGYTPQNGTLTASPIWFIQRISKIWDETTILRSNGVLAFESIRDDRATLSYS